MAGTGASTGAIPEQTDLVAGPVKLTVLLILFGGQLRQAGRRPSKVISKAFNAAFHRLVQRLRPRPVGSKLIVVR